MIGLSRAFAMFTSASMIGSLTQVVKGKLTAVFLGSEGVGILNQLTNLWGLFSIFASLGFYNGLVRHLSPLWSDGARSRFQRHLSSSALVMMGLALILTLIGVLFSNALSDFIFDDGGARSGLISLILLSIPIYIAGLIYRAMLNAVQAVSAMVRTRIAADVLSVIVLSLMIIPFGLSGAIVGYIALHLLYLGFIVFYVKKECGPDLLLPDPRLYSTAEMTRNLGFGINGVVSVAVGIVTALIVSRWIITTDGMASNGVYAMGLKIATVYLGGLSAAAGGYYFPALSRAKTDTETYEIIDETLTLYLYVIPPIVVLLMAFGEQILYIVFSSEFIPAAILLLFLLPGDLFRITSETVGTALVVRKRLVISTLTYALWAAVYLALAAWMLPRYGILGVAVAYLASQVLRAFLTLAICRRIVGYRMSRHTLGSLLRGVAMVVAVSIFMQLEYSIAAKWASAGTALAAWIALSLLDQRFRSQLLRFLTRFKIS